MNHNVIVIEKSDFYIVLISRELNNYGNILTHTYYSGRTGMTSDHFADECTQKWNNGSDITLKCFPMAMDSHAKFGYTLFFILVPWPFFIYEFFTSQHYDILVTKGARIVVSTFF